MAKKGQAKIQRGQAITFRLPSDTPDHIIKQLQKLKETERRNFSSTIASFVLEGVSKTLSKERETVTIPLPRKLSKEQRNWLKHAHSEALLGTIVYELLADPVRATSILASLTSDAIDINEALYLQENEMTSQEQEPPIESQPENETKELEELVAADTDESAEDDLINFDLDKARQELDSLTAEAPEEDEEEDAEDLLGEFLSQMNK